MSEMKYLETEAKAIKLDQYPHGAIEFVASTGARDRDGDIIDPEGWDLKGFKKNGGPLLFNHNHAMLVGQVFQITNQSGDKLQGKARFSKIPLAQEVRTLVDEGILKHLSVGFRPLETDDDYNKDGVHFTKQELIEVSLATVPSNLEAEIIEHRSADFPILCKMLEFEEPVAPLPEADIDEAGIETNHPDVRKTIPELPDEEVETAGGEERLATMRKLAQRFALAGAVSRIEAASFHPDKEVILNERES